MKQLLTLALVVFITGLCCSKSVNAQLYQGIDLFTLELPTDITNLQTTPYAAGGQVVATVRYGPDGQAPAAPLLWDNPSGSYSFLEPREESGDYPTFVEATDGFSQVGGRQLFAQGFHARLWQGTPESAVDLHPTNLSGLSDSYALGLGGSQQVGYGDLVGPGGERGQRHALLWNGTADSAVDLHPGHLTEFIRSIARATDGIQQVGVAVGDQGPRHAMLWNGTAETAVDLHPAFLVESNGVGVADGQQVGSGYGTSTSSRTHALLWTGNAESVIDLHPPNMSPFDNSVANSTNGTKQVGYLFNTDTANRVNHAVLWSGTSASAIDLNSLLPFAAIDSTASFIAPDGSVFGVAVDVSRNIHAVKWVAVPEPALGLILLLACLLQLLLCRRYRPMRCKLFSAFLIRS